MIKLTRTQDAIIVILSQMGRATYPEITRRGNGPMADPLMLLVKDGIVIREGSNDKIYYRLRDTQ